jgi:hypothetical protein
MTGLVLVELHGGCRTISDTGLVLDTLSDALPLCTGSTVRLLTDWGSGAVFGIATVMGQASAAAAILEKQLRNQGETDDIAQILVHQSQNRMGSTKLVYTAIPVKTWRHYQQMAASHSQLLLVYDWVRTLMSWAKTRGLSDGILIATHTEGIDVLVLEKGRVIGLDRLNVFHDVSDAWARLGLRVVSRVSDLAESDASVAAMLMKPVVLLACQGTETFLHPLIQSLNPLVVSEVWAEGVDIAGVQLKDTPLKVQPLDWLALSANLPLRQSVNRQIDKAAAWADQWLPYIGIAAFGLSCIMAVTAAGMHYKTELAQALASGEMQRTKKLWESLNTDVQQAEKLAMQQKDMREWVQQRVASSKVPDLSMVLTRIKKALPSGMVIDEVSLLVEKETHLVTVIGHATQIEDSLRSESAFVQDLKNDGFSIQKRDLVLREGLPKFKLSMTWSAM